MCGITGAVWSRPESSIDRQTLSQMTTALKHRGPDDEGYFSSQELADHKTGDTHCLFGFRRLSIIDLDGGHQPLSNEDKTIWIAFNGEIYNYRELRKSLLSRGHRFATQSDTEVIVHLYEELGLECIRELRGMFAIAIWDQRRQRLLLARDRLGLKPLFYRQDDDRLLFGSELKALLQVPGLPREISPNAIDQFLTYQYIPHPDSIFKGFHKLAPGHIATFEAGKLTVRRYWQAPYEPDPATAEDIQWPADRWKRTLRETLTEAVRLRMRSDVPIGAFLSGGVDSTIIAGLMQSLSRKPIHTFSIGFAVPEFDERSYAREAATRLGTQHHEFVVQPSALESLPQLIWHYDEPFGDSSAIPTMALAELTKRFVTVALSGDGGDELFAGYKRYHAVDLASRTDWLPSSVKSFLATDLLQRIPSSTRQRSFGRRLKRFLAALGQSPEKRYLRWIGIFDQEARNSLYTKEFLNRLDGFDSSQLILNAYQASPSRDFLTRTTFVDVQTYLPCDILTKVDIASMAFGLEARSPFLDHRVAELAARMPIDLKYRNGKGKLILLDTFSDLLPQSIQKRPKMGFGVPIDHWFRKELAGFLKQVLLSERSLDRGYFKREGIQRLIDEHLSNQWDHSYKLWNLLCLECWHRIYADQVVSVHPPKGMETM